MMMFFAGVCVGGLITAAGLELLAWWLDRELDRDDEYAQKGRVK